MKLLLLLAALTTTSLAKPLFGSWFETSTAAPAPTAPKAFEAPSALCTLLFYPLEDWFSFCPQYDDNDNDSDDDKDDDNDKSDNDDDKKKDNDDNDNDSDDDSE